MKKSIIIFFSFLIAFTALSQPKRVILFMIDGLHWEAPERVHMPVFNRLIPEGTYIKKSYVLIPHHPTIGDYSTYNSCSFPNPVLHEGTIFLSPSNKMIQEYFSPQEQTAFIVNTIAYSSVGRGFSTLIMDDTLTDSMVVDHAITILDTQSPVFTRVHLQRPGQRGYDISQSSPDKPYHRNIFAPGSPYIEAIENADRQLGRFVDYLKESGIWDDTILIITSDHGQSRVGWHPLFDEESWQTPLLFLGNGISRAKTLDYFEQIDLAPTIVGLLGKKWQSREKQSGKFVKEILTASTECNSLPRPTYIKTINQQIKEFNLLKSEFILLSEIDTHYGNLVSLLENETFMEPFYHQDRILDWHKAGTIDHLIEANQKVLHMMRENLPVTTQ